jgi:hypothetical protein
MARGPRMPGQIRGTQESRDASMDRTHPHSGWQPNQRLELTAEEGRTASDRSGTMGRTDAGRPLVGPQLNRIALGRFAGGSGTT